MLTEAERRAIVESGPIYTSRGMKVHMGGWKNPDYCSVTTCEPGFWMISWECAQRVAARENRRMDWLDNMFRTSNGWLGCTPQPSDFQTPEDYERYMARRA